MGTNEKLLLLGAKGGAKMCIDAIQAAGQFDLVGIVDSLLPKGTSFYGTTVLGNEAEFETYLKNGINHIAIAFTVKDKLTLRANVIGRLKSLGFKFPNLIHPGAVVESTTALGEGNIFVNKSYIGSDCSVGSFNFFNPGAIINHDVLIGDNNHFSSGCVIAGYAVIGHNNCIGAHTVVDRDYAVGNAQFLRDLTLYSNVKI